MNAIPEVTERELTYEQLAERYRGLCNDRRFEDLPGKIELDLWGRMLMSPASNYHGVLQIRLGQCLLALGGQAIAEASVLTPLGLQVADVAWASPEFMQAHGSETPFVSAPELCIEVASPSNSIKGLREKSSGYLSAGALEAWIVFPHSKRIEVHAKDGLIERTRFAVDLTKLFP